MNGTGPGLLAGACSYPRMRRDFLGKTIAVCTNILKWKYKYERRQVYVHGCDL